MRTPRALAAAALIAAVAILASACGGIKNPEGWASPAITDNAAFVMLKKDRLSSLEIRGDGSAGVQWTFPDKDRFLDQKDISLRAVYGEPVVEGDTVYFGAYEDGVFALNSADGSIKWHVDDVEGGIVNDIAVSDRFVAFGTNDGVLYVLNKADGSPAPGWSEDGKKFDKGIWATPVIQGDTLYVATMGGDLHALNLADGSERWAKPFEVTGAIADIVRVGDQRLLVPSLNKHVYLVNMADGTELGDFRASDWVWTLPAVKDDIAYFGDFAGKVYAVDINNNMSLVWEYDAGSKVKAGPAIVEDVPNVGDVLVVADRKPVVHFLDLHTGKVLGNTIPIPNAGTVRAGVTVHDKLAYVLTTDEKLFVADPSGPAPTVRPIGIGAAQ